MGYYIPTNDDVRSRTRKTATSGTDKAVSGHRYFHPGIGRWINRDSKDERGFAWVQRQLRAVLTNPYRMSWDIWGQYLFVNNSPICNADLLGLRSYKTDDSVCKWAAVSGEDGGDGGGFICSRGEPYLCIWDDKARKEVKDCLVKHEKKHWEDGDIQDCSKCVAITRADWPPSYDQKKKDKGECEAYKVTLACLIDSKATACNGLSGPAKTACEAEFDAVIKQHQGKVDEKCKYVP